MAIVQAGKQAGELRLRRLPGPGERDGDGGVRTGQAAAGGGVVPVV